MATSTIQTTVNLIQSLIDSNISEIRTASSDFYPDNLSTAQLPAIFTIPENGENVRSTFGNKQETIRTYSIRCFINPIGQSRTDLKAVDAIGLLQSVVDLFQENKELQQGVTIESITDSGLISGANIASNDLVKMMIAGQAYNGFVVNLTVRGLYECV